MPAFFPILETLLKRVFWYRQQLLFWLSFYLLNPSKTLSFHRCLQFWEKENVSGGQVQWIRWLRHDCGFVFGQKLMHNYRIVRWCVIMVENDRAFHNSVRFWRIASCNRRINQGSIYWPYDLVAWVHNQFISPLQSKKTVSNIFTFDRTWCAFFGIVSSRRFHWYHWVLVSIL